MRAEDEKTFTEVIRNLSVSLETESRMMLLVKQAYELGYRRGFKAADDNPRQPESMGQ